MLAPIILGFFVPSEVYESRISPANFAATQATFNNLLPALAFAVDHISAVHADLQPGFPAIHRYALPMKQG